MTEMTDLKSCDDPRVDEGADAVTFVWKSHGQHNAPNDPSSATASAAVVEREGDDE